MEKTTHQHYTQLTNVGNIYATQCKIEEADKMYERTLQVQGYEMAWGLDHTGHNQ